MPPALTVFLALYAGLLVAAVVALLAVALRKPKDGGRPRLILAAALEGPLRALIILKGGDMVVLTDVQKCALAIQRTGAKGDPAPVGGAPQWAVSDANALEIQRTWEVLERLGR